MKVAKILLIFAGVIFVGVISATDRIIVKYKPTDKQISAYARNMLTQSELTLQMMSPLSSSSINGLSKKVGYNVREVGQVADGSHVLSFGVNLDDAQVNQILAKLKSESNIEYAEVDRLLKPLFVPTYNQVQWDMLESSQVAGYGTAYGDNFVGAWNYWDRLYPATKIGNGVVVAVLDTGYTPHSKIINGLTPYAGVCSSNNGIGGCYGYQFISDCRISGSCVATISDSSAQISPKPDGLDLGDYLTASDANTAFFSGCPVSNSSWHGTHVTGTIIGSGYSSGAGMLGGAYGAKVLPLRVLGKCGGYTSDISNAILYAVNRYPGLTNPNKADIISMSLGGYETCSSDATMQSAINVAVNAGAIVVVAAGNSSDDIANYTPAGCSNVVSVAAKGINNALSWYSNYGKTTITASGGNSYSPSSVAKDEIYSTLWGSTQAFGLNGGEKYVYYEGTSMATPHVSAALADIISLLKAKNNSYSNVSLVSILQNSASFDYYQGIASNGYGFVSTGILDVANALKYADTAYTSMLTANIDNLSIYGTVPQTITFTNKQNSPIAIESTQLIGINSVMVSHDGCIRTTLVSGNSCSITLAPDPSVIGNNSEIDQGSLQLINSSGSILSSVAVNYTVLEPETPSNVPNNSTAGGNGGTNLFGGCSLSKGNSDDSILLILLSLAFYYFIRRKYFKR